MTVETLQRKLKLMESQRGKGVYKDPGQLERYITYLKNKIARKIMKFDKYAHLRPKKEEPKEEVQESGKKPKRRHRKA